MAPYSSYNCACVMTLLSHSHSQCLERLSLYIKDQNRILYDRLGLELMDPVDNGYRYVSPRMSLIIRQLKILLSRRITPTLKFLPD